MSHAHTPAIRTLHGEPEARPTLRAEPSSSIPASGSYKRRYRGLQFFVDLAALTAAWLATVELRVALNSLFAAQFTREELAQLAPPLGGILVLWIAAAAYLRLYSRRTSFRATAGLRGVGESAVLVAIIAVVATFFSRHSGANLSRSFVILFLPLSFLVMTGTRYVVLALTVFIERRWPLPERVAVIGFGEAALDIVRRVASTPGGAATPQGVVLPLGITATGLRGEANCVGDSADLAALINRHRIDRVVMVDNQVSEQERDDCAAIAQRMGVAICRSLGPSRPDTRLEVREVQGLDMIEMHSLPHNERQETLKRLFDATAAGCFLVALSPFLFVLSILIKMTSRGPLLYQSLRVGKGGRHFTLLKFRSMFHGNNGRNGVAGRNERNGHIFKIREDPRVTSLGKWMRRYSVDELPQLVNVFRGEMSLVGPRPLPAEDLEDDGQSNDFADWAAQRSTILPGLTGLVQINGRSDLEFNKWIELDTYYFKHRSLRFDLRILLETPLVVLTGHGAY